MSEHDVVDIIRAKRDGEVLTGDQVRWTIASYTRGEVAEEQMSALLMAIFLNGLGAEELTHWTEAMIDSGRRMHLALDRPTTDKH
ncbi:MAG: thymidine phosphorylase, partial [Antricoccus sp.]